MKRFFGFEVGLEYFCSSAIVTGVDHHPSPHPNTDVHHVLTGVATHCYPVPTSCHLVPQVCSLGRHDGTLRHWSVRYEGLLWVQRLVWTTVAMSLQRSTSRGVPVRFPRVTANQPCLP